MTNPHTFFPRLRLLSLAGLLLVSTSLPALAGAGAPGHAHGPAKGHHMPGGHMMGGHGTADIGGPGKAADVKRTIDVTMQDNFYEPEKISVKAGETVRFRIVNKGTLLHEFGLGTAASHAEHKKMMAMMVEHGMIEADRINHERMKMSHGPGQGHMDHMHGPESGSVLVEPGKSAEIIWTFPKAMTLEYACTIPGHYELGMVGPLKVQ